MKRVNNIANPFSSSDRRMSTLHEANRILYYIAQAYLQQIHVRIQDFKLGGGGGGGGYRDLCFFYAQRAKGVWGIFYVYMYIL